MEGVVEPGSVDKIPLPRFLPYVDTSLFLNRTKSTRYTSMVGFALCQCLLNPLYVCPPLSPKSRHVQIASAAFSSSLQSEKTFLTHPCKKDESARIFPYKDLPVPILLLLGTLIL
jgi:hypothetical protein